MPNDYLENRVVDGRPTRVLLVDDDSDYQVLCKRYFSQAPEKLYTLDSAVTAAEAMVACRQDDYDCIVVDYHLPDAVGTELVCDLHNLLGEWMPPVVILTAGGGEKAATKAIRVNATDFLSKRDVTSSSLCRSIDNAVKQARLKTAIRERNVELNDAYKNLQHKTEEINKFYHSVSHEVKTPLTAIREFLSLLSDEVVGPVNDDQKQLLNYSLDSCDQISDHFDDLLDLTRLETGKLCLKRQWVSPSQLISRCTKAISGIAKNKGVELIDLSESTLPEINIDPNRIAQVISNILTNALKYTETGGYIHVDSHYDASNECIYIGIQDSGCGIGTQHVDRIFDRLFQVNQHNDSETNVGLGLGLSISRELVHLHGGQLGVKSQLGVGSIFTLQLSANDETYCYSHSSM